MRVQAPLLAQSIRMDRARKLFLHLKASLWQRYFNIVIFFVSLKEPATSS